MRIAFFAPMKPPDDPVPSGDRTMVRALVTALRKGGHMVDLASRTRFRLSVPDPPQQERLARAAAEEADVIACGWHKFGPPDLWFTYHNYHKAPDLLGAYLARRFAIPYAIAEASHAPRRAAAWTSWFQAAEQATRAADLHVCLTQRDRAGIAPLLRPEAHMVDLPPFLDLDGFPDPVCLPNETPVRLVTIAMMRAGDKLDSYRFLATALGTIGNHAWHLDIVGDGPGRPAVMAAFASLPADRITWHGALEAGAVRRCLAEAQLFVWPGFGEAFGVAYLEAQAMGLPVVALDVAGVSSVVEAGRTGLLVAEAMPDAFGAAIAGLIRDDGLRATLGRQASAFVRRDRTLTSAARVLDGALRRLVTSRQ